MPDLWMDVDIALSEVPINILSLIDDTDFKSREESVVYNQAGLDLVWNFQTTAGVRTQTAVTPTDTAGDYDWVNQGNGDYTIEMPASGGASINNDTEGFGWFEGFATGILPWRGPVIGFRAAAINNALIDGGDELDVNVIKVSNTTQTANDNGADINTILARIIGTLATGTHNPQSGDGFSRIGAAGVSLTNLGGMSTAMKAEVESEVIDGLIAANVVLLSTTIATLASQISFTLTAGSADDDAFNDCLIVIRDASTATQKAVGIIGNYVGGSKTVTLSVDPAIFTMAVSDFVDIIPYKGAAKADLATSSELADAVNDDIVEGTWTFRKLTRIIASALFGKTTNNGKTFRDVDDTKNRITATTDSNRNRTAVSLDGD